MKSFKEYLTEEVFIGHKVKYQEFQKFIKGWSDRIRIVTNKLKENSNTGQYGEFCKDYPEYVALYWYCNGRKLQPTKRECEDLIRKAYEIKKPIDSLTSDEKWELFNHGCYVRD